MNSERMNDMLDRYGEVCDQTTAAKILSVSCRTISRMMEEGRLRRVDRRVDVRSIAEYIENPKQADFEARCAKRHNKPTQVSREDFLAAARKGHWNTKGAR